MPDLTLHPARSPRVRLGGYVILPRILDKCRATLLGKHGEYKYACPLDQRWFEFVGIDPEALKKEAATGIGDGKILAWVAANARCQRTDSEISGWSALQEARVPGEPDSRAYYNGLHSQIAPERGDVFTWFDLLDLDDYVSFGGKP